MEQQLCLWDFIPECEDGKKARSYLLFDEEAYFLRDNSHDLSEPEQMDIFDFLDIGDEECAAVPAHAPNETTRVWTHYFELKRRGRHGKDIFK